MKNVLWMVVALLVGWAVPAAWADGVQGGMIGSGEQGSSIKTYVMPSAKYPAGQNAISGFSKDSIVFGFKTVPDNGVSSSYCTLYDAASVVGAADSTVIDELPEQSGQRGPQIQMWPFPFRLVTGLSIGARNASCIVYYR